MKHFTVKNAPVHVALENEYNESQNRPLQGLLVIRPDRLTFTQTIAPTRTYHHNPHIYEGRFITVTVNDRGVVRITPRKELASLVQNRSEVEREISKALDALAKL